MCGWVLIDIYLTNSITTKETSLKKLHRIVELFDEVKLTTAKTAGKSSRVVQCVKEAVGFSFLYFKTDQCYFCIIHSINN